MGEVLVELGFLSTFQVHQVLEKQTRRILACGKCVRRFNIIGFEPGYVLRCPRCGSVLASPADDSLISVEEDVYLEREGMAKIPLFALFALQLGWLSAEDLDRAMARNAKEGTGQPIEDTLAAMGLVTRDQTERIHEFVKRGLGKEASVTEQFFKQTLFGQIAISEELMSETRLNAALREQVISEARESRRMLGEILLEQGSLTRHQIVSVLARQAKKISACQGCRGQYNLVGFDGQEARCPECRGVLEIAAEPQDLNVLDDVVPPEVENCLTQIELGGEGGARTAVLSSRSQFDSFYQSEGISRDESLPPTVRADGELALIPATVARGRLRLVRVRRMAARSRRLFLALSLVPALLAVGAFVGHFLDRSPPGASSGESTPTPDPVAIPALAAGAPVDVFGRVPAGAVGEVAIVEPDRQAFLVRVGPKSAYWAIDAAGASFDRLQFLRQERHAAIEKPVHVRGVLCDRPADLAFPPVAVEGYVQIEFWRLLDPRPETRDPSWGFVREAGEAR